MRVLVTGATGLVGRALSDALAARGHAIVALSRHPGSAGALPPGTERIQWDALAAPAPARAFADVDAIVHLAGETVGQRWTAARKRRIRDSRVIGTRNLLAPLAALAPRPRVLVCASAIGIYGDRGEETITESSPPGSGFLPALCTEWETAAMGAEGLGLRVVRLRIGVVLAADGGALGRLLVPFKLGLGGPVGHGRQWVSWIDRTDVVGLALHAIENPDATGAWNATAPEPVRNADLARALGAVLRRPAILPTPAFALRLAFGDMAEVLLGGQRVLPARAEASGYAFHQRSLEPALRAILAPRS